jgi:molybdate transport system substrate-binding protein
MRLLLAALCLTLATDATAQAAKGGKRQIVVSAAVSLTDVLQQIAPLYQAKSGEQIVLNLASSNTLARQISFGAGADVFISADEAQMNAVASYIDPATRVDLLSNQLAIAVPDDRPRRIASARDLLDSSIRRIAIGDPAAVPAGVYAKQYLQTLGIWTDLAMKIVPSGSVRLALAAVESGAADAAIVYRTDIASARHVREALVVPSSEGPHIVYPAAMVRSGSNADGARRFLAFLRTPEVIAVFTRAGFLVPAAASK